MKIWCITAILSILSSCSIDETIDTNKIVEPSPILWFGREPENVVPSDRLVYSKSDIDSIILNSILLHNQWNTYSSHFVYDSIRNENIKMGFHNLWHLDTVSRKTINRGNLGVHIISKETEKIVCLNLMVNAVDIVPPIQTGSTLNDLNYYYPHCLQIKEDLWRLKGRGYCVYFLIQKNKIVSVNYLNLEYEWYFPEVKFIKKLRNEYTRAVEFAHDS